LGLKIWSILWPFGIFRGHLGAFFPFWYVVSRKNLATFEGTPTVQVKSKIAKNRWI
jgi:hypothetical protein